MIKKTLLVVNNNLNIGGVQKSLVNFLHTFKDEYDITLCLFSKTGSYINDLPDNIKVVETKSIFRYLGLSQREVAKNYKDYLIRGLLALITKIFGKALLIKLILILDCDEYNKLEKTYDAAISFLHNGPLKSFYGGVVEFTLNKIKANKYIAFIHCDYKLCGANNKYNNSLYKKFNYIACCSDGCRKVFLESIPELKDRTIVIRNTHNFDLISNMAKEPSLTFDTKNINIVTIARLSKEKGIDRAITAIQYCLHKGNKIQYFIVGDGPERSKLEVLIQKNNLLKNIHFIGNSTNPYKYLRHADILLITSYHEAAPLVIDEAVSLGVPVFSTKTTSSAEMIEDRLVGWVCNNNQEELTKELYRVVNNYNEILQKKQKAQNIKCSNSDVISTFKRLV